MGCSSSLIQPDKSPQNAIIDAHTLVTDIASPIQKVKAFEAIKKNDSFLVEQALQEISPLENLGLPGDNFTCLHAAAQCNSFQAMEVLLSWLHDHKKSFLESILQNILEIPSSDDKNPLEICIMNDSSETFFVLLSSKCVNYRYKNKLGQNLHDLCRQYSPNCLELLERTEGEHFSRIITDIQFDSNDTIIKDSDDHSNEKRKIKAGPKKMETMALRVKKVKETAKEQKAMRKILAENDSAAIQGLPHDSKVYQLLEHYVRKKNHMIDPDFKTCLQSITTEEKHRYYSHFKKAVWRRPNELFQCTFPEIFLFDKIDPHDIAQGILGVCYLLSSLSALAEFPSRLTRIFINRTSNKYGVYGLKFYIRGIPIEIVIDDHFPCYGDRKNYPLFAKPKGKELWVLLAEKAWAKVYGNYVACEEGFMDEALEYLLGTPAMRCVTSEQSAEEIWEILSDADKNKFVLCAATNSAVTKEMGLIANHAYSIISTYSLFDHKIIKLRNPWGKFEWKGDFADNSPVWTDELKQRVGYVNADDGLFCMNAQDFKNCFEYISIGVYHEGWEYTYLEVESEPNHAEYFIFTVDEPCTIYVRIHQEDKRLLSKQEQENFKYASADLIVAKFEDDGTYSSLLDDPKMAHSGTFFGARTIYPSKKCKLEIEDPGEYVIRTKLRWLHGKKDKFTLSVYAPMKIELERIDPIKDFLPQLFKHIGQKSEKKDLENDCSMVHEFYLHSFYFYFENKSDQKWIIDIKFPKLQNLKLGKANKKTPNSFHLQISPGQSKLVIVKKVDVSAAASYSWELEHQLV